ncbi:MAG: hypothetical protein PHG60_02215 [Candidatus Dojkabacteria bacterium]|jgi:glutaredoxin|nr:hypothetical protein [Candidatus Dojkabacteria bacterium]MDD2270371.1 hypothetical protein [Candidatus Dojkabacteria bacterium]
MANNKKGNNAKTVTSKLSVHVIFYSCPDCGHEIEHVEFCDKCGKEMRVIDVVEKFGSEAQEIIEQIKSLKAHTSEYQEEEESPNIIIISEEDEEGVNDDDDNTITEEEVLELDDIFADNDETSALRDNSVDISDLTMKLDESDEENTFEDMDIDPDDLPEL